MAGEANPLRVWKRLHWSFFVNTQGLTIALLRFERALEAGNEVAAREELRDAAVLMRAAGASMRLAGSFSAEDYQERVRPTMTPPAIGADNFSGLMSWDHARLIRLWRRLRPVFADLPESLREAHDDFVAAYRVLATSHHAVCSRFAGDGGSLRNKDQSATKALRRLERRRLELIDPPRGKTDTDDVERETAERPA
ncbi:MAG: siderophore biosynthesis protein [Pseudomonadota bacterium]